MNPHQVTKDFERALCLYTGAPYAVAVNSCTMALLLSVAWHVQKGAAGFDTLKYRATMQFDTERRVQVGEMQLEGRPVVEIPKRTYVSVPMSIIHAGARPAFRDEDWIGAYQLKPLPVWDCARWFTSGLWRATHIPGTRGPWFRPGSMVCVSFHWSKTLGIQQGGAILHDDPAADAWLRRARFDGRTEGIPPSLDNFTQVGWHCYMSPEVAAEGLMRLSILPRQNDPLPNDHYPDLSEMEIFR